MADYVRLVRELRIAPIPKLILYAVATRADAEGICWPSIQTLCDDTGLVRRSVQTHLRNLVEDRLILREARTGRPNVFRLNIEAWRSTTSTSARDAPVDTKLAESAPAARPPRSTCTGGALHMPMTSAGPAPEVTKKYPLNFPLKLPVKFTPTGSTRRTSSRNPWQERPSRWWTTEAGINRKGAELGVEPRIGETYQNYKSRLFEIEQGRQRRLNDSQAKSAGSSDLAEQSNR